MKRIGVNKKNIPYNVSRRFCGCNDRFLTKEEAYAHVRALHIHGPIRLWANVMAWYQCLFCGKVETNLAELESHTFAEHTFPIYKCYHCPYEITLYSQESVGTVLWDRALNHTCPTPNEPDILSGDDTVSATSFDSEFS